MSEHEPKSPAEESSSLREELSETILSHLKDVKGVYAKTLDNLHFEVWPVPPELREKIDSAKQWVSIKVSDYTESKPVPRENLERLAALFGLGAKVVRRTIKYPRYGEVTEDLLLVPGPDEPTDEPASSAEPS